MPYIKVIVLCAFLINTCGCAVVSDKGRYENISNRYEGLSCSDKKELVVYVSGYKTRLYGSWNREAKDVKYYEMFLEKTLSKSKCFNKITFTPFATSEKKENVMYFEIQRNADLLNGFIPVITPLVGIVIPMSYSNDFNLTAKVHYNGKDNNYEIDDQFNALQWFPVMLVYPFLKDPGVYIEVKDKDIIDALVYKLKSDKILSVN